MKQLTPEYREKLIKLICDVYGWTDYEVRKMTFARDDKLLQLFAEWSALIIPETFEAGKVSGRDEAENRFFNIEDKDLESFQSKIIEQPKSE